MEPIRLLNYLFTDKEDDSVGVGEVPGVSQPGAEVVVGAAPRDVVHHQGTRRPSVVRPGDKQIIITCRIIK